MLAEKQRAKQLFQENVTAPEPDIPKPEPREEATIASRISDAELLNLAQSIPPQNVILLGLALGFDMTAVNQFYKGSPDRGTFEMLKTWRDRTRGTEQRHKLKHILRKAEIGALATMLDETPFPKGNVPFTNKI